jgi:3-oxosteroid 1-dehydrogenase
VRGAPSVIVVGSGAAGMAAALGAAASGAAVRLVERSQWVGGTTAMSGGVVWMPGHGRDPGAPGCGATGERDDRDEALVYVQAASASPVDTGAVAAFLGDTKRVTDEIERRTPVVWEVLARWPDYRGELPGARPGGRSLWPRALELARGVESRVQPALDQPTPGSSGSPHPVDDAPAHDGVVLRGHVRGRALAGGLLTGVLEAGVDVRTEAGVEGLAMDGGVVAGVVVDGAVHRGAVVLATGGFQHDDELVAAHLRGAPVVAMGAAGCRGDGLRWAQGAGAALGNMDEGWWMPAIHVPGEEVDGVAHYRPLHGERAQPGSILVDGTGRRFVDEAQNYGDVGRAMRRRGGPWWLVLDGRYRRRYPLGPLTPADPDPAWMACAPDVGDLATRIGVPRASLVDAVTRFNAGARRGEDPEFGRGTRPYDRWIGDGRAPHPTIAPLDTPPYYALEVHLGCMGTKGGPRTDAHGRVLCAPGSVVPGLYAAGNAAASPFGTATVAGGATLGPALVFGYRAGEAAARHGA